jgi:hypothetical protein
MADINIRAQPMQEENYRLNGKPKHITLPEVDNYHA